MPLVSIPPPYRGPTQGKADVQVQASDVRACLLAVDAEHPGFSDQIFDADGEVHVFVKLFLNGDLLRPDQLDRAVGPDDEVGVIAAIAGG
jgi:molybdopterin converting factor small subunit